MKKQAPTIWTSSILTYGIRMRGRQEESQKRLTLSDGDSPQSSRTKASMIPRGHTGQQNTIRRISYKGLNSDIIRFLRNDMRDVQVLNWVGHGGAADNPLLGGYKLEGFEGWGGDQDFNNYLYLTFAENLPTKFLQHYQVIDWENYAEGESPVGNQEKQITLKNGDDKVVVTRNEAQRSDEIIEREITLNDKTVLSATNDHFYYLLPWTDSDTKETKLYHYNLEGGTSTWNVPDGFTGNLTMYELSDQGRGEAIAVPVSNGQITLEAKQNSLRNRD